jgi:hypothetical protein
MVFMMSTQQRVLGYMVEYLGKGEDVTYKVMDNGDKIEVDHQELLFLIASDKVYMPKGLSSKNKLVYYKRG